MTGRPASSATDAVSLGVDIFDTHRGQFAARVALPDPIVPTYVPMALDETGERIFVISSTGVTVAQLAHAPLSVASANPPQAHPGVQLRLGSGFTAGATVSFGTALGELLWFAWYGSKLGWRDTAFRSRLIGRGYFQNDVLLSRLRPKDEGEGQTGRRQCGRRVVARRIVSLLIGAQYENGIVDRSHIPGRNKDFGDTGKGSHAEFAANIIGGLRLTR